MAQLKHWYLICYDIRCPKRWRKAYKLLEGYGSRVQYSLFRCWLSQREREKLRWYNRPNAWTKEESGYRIL